MPADLWGRWPRGDAKGRQTGAFRSAWGFMRDLNQNKTLHERQQ
jgi:hypothetical protein